MERASVRLVAVSAEVPLDSVRVTNMTSAVLERLVREPVQGRQGERCHLCIYLRFKLALKRRAASPFGKCTEGGTTLD